MNKSEEIARKVGRHLDSCWHIYTSTLGGAALFAAPIIFNSREENLWKLVAFILGLIGAALVVAPLIRERNIATKKEIDGEAQLRAQMLVFSEYTLTPLLQKLDTVLRHSKGSVKATNNANVFRLAALTATRELITPGNPKTTANYFRYIASTDGKFPRLALVSSTGSPPRDEFTLDDSPLGKSLQDMLSKNTGWLYEDVDADPPPGWDASKSRNYRTFISITSQAGDKPAGMLTVDSDTPGALDESGLQLTQLFATLIAVAENHCKT